MATVNPQTAAPQTSPQQAGAFYDAKFGIEAMQHEPYENGFTWRTVLGAFFIAFVMLPGVIFMGLMIGSDLGTAADWVTIILFVELARRSFMTLRKQELYILRYAVSHLSHAGGGLMLGGGIFASLIAQRYMRGSEAFQNFGIAHVVPNWFAPYGDMAQTNNFLAAAWLPVVGVLVMSMFLSKITQLSLGYLVYKVVSDVEQLPFPMAPVYAEGAIALAESSQDANKKGFRQYCFSIGVIIGAAFGIFYVAVPTLSMAFLGKAIQIIPIPFLDLTKSTEQVLPSALIGISLNIGLLFAGFVLPWRIVLGTVVTSIVFQVFLNPFVFHRLGMLPHWAPGKDVIMGRFSNDVDLYMSIGIGTAFAVFGVGVAGLVKAISKFNQSRKGVETSVDIRKLFQRDIDRGDPPTWVPFVLWLVASIGFVLLSNALINGGIPADQRFSIWWLIMFAFFWTPVNTYINARMAGIAGQGAQMPYVFESAVFASGYRYVNIWFAPLPLQNYGSMATMLRETQLTRTKFTSILKAELLIFPLMLVASFIFWTYITSLGPIPSDNYPYAQKFWPQAAMTKALWAASKQEGQSLLLQAIKPMVIGITFAATTLLFILFGAFGISAQFLYGAIGGVGAYPHDTIMIFFGALLGRYYFARRFGQESWQNFAPILMVGVGAGMGLVGMLSIAINFLWVSIGTGN